MKAMKQEFGIWLFIFIVFVPSKTFAAPTTTTATEISINTSLPDVVDATNVSTIIRDDQILLDSQSIKIPSKTKTTKKIDRLELELSSIADDIGNKLNDIIINEEGWSIEPRYLDSENALQPKKLHKKDISEQTTDADNLLNEVDSENNSTDHENKNGHGHNQENNHDQPQNHQHWSAGLWNHTLSKTSAVLGPVQHALKTLHHRVQNPPGVHHGNGRDDFAAHHHSGSHVSRPGDHHSIETEEERLKIEDSLGFHVLEFFGTIAGLLWGLFSNIQRIFSSGSTPSSS